MTDSISAGLVLALITGVKPPSLPTVEQLRRRARFRGIKSIDGRALRFARRQQLITALQMREAISG